RPAPAAADGYRTGWRQEAGRKRRLALPFSFLRADRLRLRVLPLGTLERDAALGPPAHDARLHGSFRCDPRRTGRRAGLPAAALAAGGARGGERPPLVRERAPGPRGPAAVCAGSNG